MRSLPEARRPISQIRITIRPPESGFWQHRGVCAFVVRPTMATCVIIQPSEAAWCAVLWISPHSTFLVREERRVCTGGVGCRMREYAGGFGEALD